MKKHDCIKWIDEGRGCSICSKILLKMNKKDIVEIQNTTNWYLSEANKERYYYQSIVNYILNNTEFGEIYVMKAKRDLALDE